MPDQAENKFGRNGLASNVQSQSTIDELVARPERIFDLSVTEMFSLPVKSIAEYQLRALQKRFSDLKPKISVLEKLAEEQQIETINSIEDGAKLLFQHSVYKSYPLSFIEKNQFGRMTKWISNLTSHDLSAVDSTNCQSIDDWLQCLDAQSPLRLVHSSGTSGKLSFLPHSTVEMPTKVKAQKAYFQGFSGERNEDISDFAELPFIYFSYRQGGMAHSRMLDSVRDEMYGGDESKIYTLFPYRLSADVLSLAGRLVAADAQGERGQIKISDQVLKRREHFISEQSQIAEHSRLLLERLERELKGKKVTLFGSLTDIFNQTKTGMKNLFHPDSNILVGGGTKGNVIPDDWPQRISEMLGVENIVMGYGMSESIIGVPPCPEGYFHLPPAIIAYLLDPKTGEVLNRIGTQTGRFGIIDLTAQTLWGGFLTGDKVTIKWGDTRCACGRTGARVDPDIRRYSAEEGGDDKITCAGAPKAHDNALAFLATKVD